MMDDDDFNFLGNSDDEPTNFDPENFMRNDVENNDFDKNISPPPRTPPPTNNSNRNQERLVDEGVHDDPDTLQLPKRRKVEEKRVDDEIDFSKDPNLDWFMRVDLSMSREELIKKRKEEREVKALEQLSRHIDDLRARKAAQIAQQQECSRPKRNRPNPFIHSVPPTGKTWIPCSSPGSNQRYYLIQLSEKHVEQCSSTRYGNNRNGSFLSADFRLLMREAEELIEKKKEVTCKSQENMDVSESVPDQNNNPKDLWVEKYRPRIYTDLLSDDTINRSLLTWLKLWDECVFGKKQKLFPSSQNISKENKRPFNKFKKGFDMEQLPLQLDATKRPQHKLILLCGPPGLGKTTLAQIVAKQVGYNVIEMNASDDRALQVFRDRIDSTIQASRTVNDSKPNCLIIDEIDGAPTPCINYLISLSKDSLNKGKKKQLLKRPIICICNDLYATSLRELRRTALVLQFPPTSAQRLSERLNTICRHESIRADLQALEHLCDKTSQDVRSCLNTLQFATNITAGHSHLTLFDVKNSTLGQKDAQKSLFDVWRMIFEMPRAKSRKRQLESENDLEESSNAVRFQNILHAVFACGENDKLRQGIFENYLHVKSKDNRADSASDGMEWFTLVDQMSAIISRTQLYGLMRYTSYLPVAFHFLFATNAFTKLQYPRIQFEVQQKSQKSIDTVHSIMDSCQIDSQGNERAARPEIRAFANTFTMVTDILPYLLDIIQPVMRPVNSQLYSAKEKAELHRVVCVMLKYNLTYKQERNFDGQYDYVIDPPIEQLVLYPELNVRRRLPYSVKQLISREVDLERVRHNDSVSHKPNEETQKKPSKSTEELLKKIVPTGMFGAKKETVKNTVEAKIWFKFNEGSSNAVRRNIRMRDLV